MKNFIFNREVSPHGNQLYIEEARILGNLYLGNWVIDTSYGFAIKWTEV